MTPMIRLAVAVVVTPLAFSCTEPRSPFQPATAGPAFEIQDGAHHSGNSHFFFLPPMVPQPTFSGTFDGAQSPTVVVCWWTGTACATVVAQFSTSGAGAQVVRVDATGEAYSVNWDTKQCATVCSAPRIFRVTVLVAGTELGHADVQLVTNQRELKDVTTNEFTPLVVGRTLTIKFRIEREAVFVVGSSGGTVTAVGGQVTLVVPPGAVARPTGITVSPATLPSGTNTTALVGGTAYDFGPTGTVFAAPVKLTIQYNPTKIPAGMAESTVRPFTLVNGLWLLTPDSRVNTATHLVTGTTTHFSTYGVNASASASPGLQSSCGIGTSGTAVCWGDNAFGELGNGTTTNSLTPTPVTAPPVGFTQVTVGGAHACGLGTDGTAYCWGNNSAGQLGDGTTANSATPVAVSGGLSFAAVSAGGSHTCGVTAAGEAYCWGGNEHGQLGDGTPASSSTPVAVSGGLTFAALSTGGVHTCGVTTTGAAYCWGDNKDGELGNGTTTGSATPVPVPVSGGLVFQTLSASRYDTAFGHTCGVTSAAAAYCWGENSYGQLGNGTTTSNSTPAAVSGGLTFAAVSAGFLNTCGITTVGAAYCWGDNNRGQLGDGTTTGSTTPEGVGGGLTFATVRTGAGHSCGIASAPTMNTAYCWGDNFTGQLGDPATATGVSLTPVAPSGGLTFASVSAEQLHTCGVTTANAGYCWGYNSDGQLGDGTTANSATPVGVSGGLTFAAVSAGFTHSCGLTTAGAVYCWGNNAIGQLGDGTTASSSTPVSVSGGFTFEAISTGGGYSCGLTTASAAYCWGYNGEGRLGNGSTANSSTPVAVSGGLTLATVSAGAGHACAVTPAGMAYCWGFNFTGQLGDGTTASSSTPIAVSGGLTFAAVSAATYHTCGLTTANTAYCWGSNFYGELGNGTTANSATPVPVSGGLSFAAVSAGGSHSCGITSAGAAYCWGANYNGLLGNGTTASSSTPVAVSGGLTFAAVSAGQIHTCGVTTAGVANCWGDNSLGELGNGPTFRVIPVPVATVP